MKFKISIALHPPPPSTPTPWRSDAAMHKHLVYHTEAVKSNKFITAGHSCFQEHNSTKLQEWLTDIETAADHTNESRAKLAKAKSRGLTCTLVTEAINSDKFRDEIKNLLWLRLYNADIHTYTSCFMEIQQQEMESLAAYIHWFMTEA